MLLSFSFGVGPVFFLVFLFWSCFCSRFFHFFLPSFSNIFGLAPRNFFSNSHAFSAENFEGGCCGCTPQPRFLPYHHSFCKLPQNRFSSLYGNKRRFVGVCKKRGWMPNPRFFAISQKAASDLACRKTCGESLKNVWQRSGKTGRLWRQQSQTKCAGKINFS